MGEEEIHSGKEEEKSLRCSNGGQDGKGGRNMLKGNYGESRG